MTITKEAWQSIMERYKKHIYHSDRVTNHLRDLVGIQVVTNDPLALIRNTSIGIFPDKVTGALRRDTCKTFMFKIFKGVFEVLANCDDVHTYVFCLDRFGARRREKVNRPKVVKEGEPEYLTVPPGQQEFFLDDAEMPGTTDQIFSNHLPKLAFYAYLTRFVQTQAFRDHIPAGKCFVLSGAISAREDEAIHLPPIQVFADRVVSLDHFRCDHISEGDLDVWRWAIYYNDCNCCVISYDGDVFLIGLMQIRNLVTEGSDRRILFLTRRSVGSAAVPELALKRKAEDKVRRAIAYDTVLAETGGDVQEAYRASGGLVSSTAIYNTLVLAQPATSSSSQLQDDLGLGLGRDPNFVNDDAIGQDPNSNQSDPDPDIDVVVPERDAKRRAPVWAMQYIDMVGIHDDIIRTEYDNRELRATFNRNPAVSAVLALFLSSEKVDFVETKRVSRMLGSEYFWAAFQEDPHKFRDLVMVSDSGLGDRIFSYAIDVHCLELLVLAAYTLKCKRTMKVTKAIEKEAVKLQKYRLVDYAKGGSGSGLTGLSPIITDLGAIEQELLFKAQTEKGMQNCAKYVNEDDLNVTAAQCVWLLQYWGNGVFHHYTIPDGLALDVEGHPLYGYIEQGWAPKVTVSRYKIAPPLIGSDTQQ